ncbi:MFS transporter [Paenibacillus doosanensis]|uniref:Inner membrane transport protein YnfM n=1 Tax=Paenibacillus konkukensis TaxID=2020716 RepID=A0ABY4RZ02_9BACL|nr:MULTISPECIES: MFS transporter [Paenibacillus]MCS7464893.1 MFS transporter [Paenibacillus doosanensis]UQZ87546.1 Inner membrane transport protein YnfM [Paenibacillus konkukensis]
MLQYSRQEEAGRPYTRMTVILSWTGLAVMSSLYVTIPLIPLFAEKYDLMPSQATAAGSVFSLGFAAGCLAYGALSDRYGRKRVIVLGLLALALISLLLGTVDRFGWIVALRGLQGAAAAAFSPVALAYAVEMFPESRRVTTIGFISTGFLVAGIVGQVLSGMISPHYGASAIFYVLAAVYALTFVLVLRLLPNGDIIRPQASILEPLKQIGPVIRQKNLLLAYSVAFVLLMSFVSMYTVLGSYLSGSDFGLDAGHILAIRSLGIIGMMVSPFAGRLAKQFRVRSVLFGGLLISVIGLLVMGWLHQVWLIAGTSVLFAAGIALAVPSLVALVGRLGGAARGIAVSVYTFILFAGTSVGPVLSIALMNAGSYAFTFTMLAFVLGAGLLAAFFIREQ